MMRSSLSSNYASLDEYVQTTMKRLEEQDPTLQKLLIDDFHYPEVDIDGADQYFDCLTIAKLLIKSLDSPHVNELEIRFVEVDETVSDALEQVLSCRSRTWQSISIIGCTGCEGRLMTPLSKAMEKCHRLVLIYNNFDYPTFQQIGESLRCNHTVLKSLHLKRCSLSGTKANALFDGLEANDTLEELVINFCRFDEQGVRALANGLRTNTSVRTLDLGACYLSDIFVETIISSLVGRNRALDSLVLTLNSCHERGTKAVAEFLASDVCSLAHLNLSHQKDAEDRKPCLKSLAEAIQKNTSLQSLKLSRNSLRGSEIIPLIHALTINATLRSLDLTSNLIDDTGWIEIAACLPKMKGLQSLYLMNNDLKDERAIGELLLSGIKQNTKLTDFEVTQLLPTHHIIQYYVALNWGGRQMLASSRHVPLGLWPRILERSHSKGKPECDAYKRDILFQLIRGPALLST
eukprot:scaffold2003_cov139-Cylindrotheca_fusiformis.AAC.23